LFSNLLAAAGENGLMQGASPGNAFAYFSFAPVSGKMQFPNNVKGIARDRPMASAMAEVWLGGCSGISYRAGRQTSLRLEGLFQTPPRLR
jgi:hypothetical protein